MKSPFTPASFPPNDRAGDAIQCTLSWQDAVSAAGDWLGKLRVGRNLKGQTVNLADKGHTLDATGHFRTMVLEAARRKLVKRGADTIILPD